MSAKNIVIVGGSAAGATAAISVNRQYPGNNVTVIRKEEQVLVPCGIPYIFGTIGSPQKNLIPDATLDNLGVNLIISEATSIDKINKVVKIASGDEVPYDKLILATGANPAVLPIPGIDKENVFIVKKDVAYLQSILDEVNKVKDIVIIGGGFIGAEFADECKKGRDNNVTIVEMLPHCLQLAFDDEFCLEAEQVLTESGVAIITNDGVEKMVGEGKVSGVRLSSGKEIKADMVIVSIGIVPEVTIAKKAGLPIDSHTGGIIVDRYQRVEDEEDIFACGDCAQKLSYFSGRPMKTWLASVATSEARIAAANLFETRYPGLGTVGVFSTQIGNLAIAAAGLTERQAKANGYSLVIGEAKAPNVHPGSMPGGVPTAVKLIFSRNDGTILGGEASGGTCVGEIINIVSACIQHQMTAYEVSVFQMGTHPRLCASPIAYQLVNAAETAIVKLRG